MNTDLAAQSSLDRLARVGVESLVEKDKVLATVWLFAAGVGNSGFEGYFASRRGNLAFYAPTALRAINAIELAEIATKANAVFGDGGPPPDRQFRCRCLCHLPESAHLELRSLAKAYFDCEEDVDELLEQYLTRFGFESATRSKTRHRPN